MDLLINCINIFDSYYFRIFILSMFPITELRASIPYGILKLELIPFYVMLVSIVGNILIGIVVIYVIGPSMNLIRNVKYFDNIILYIFRRTRKKGQMIYNLKFYGLIIFVAIPLPLTGVWTGALAAYLFGLSKIKSCIAIISGVLISSTIVTLISLFGKNLST